jgi:endonuclease/exonuclease/phosphatase (EEP) superfamily protein YafD
MATAAATLVPLIRRSAWWIRGFDFPRMQILALQGATLAALLPLRRRGSLTDASVLALLAASALRQGIRIRPYTRLARREAPSVGSPRPESTLRLLVANVEMSNRRADRLPELIAAADPDVILALETDGWWQEQLRPLAENYPHTIFHPLDNTYGLMFFSRLELTESELLFLVQKDVPSVRARVRHPGGEEVILYGVHPEPPSPTERKSAVPRDGELLIAGRRIRQEKGPVVIFGDLNDVAWSRTTRLFQKVSGLLDPRVGRGSYSTYHARHPLLRWPLDHIFHSPDFGVVELRVLPGFGSDHFPFMAALHYQPDHKSPETPSPDGEERSRVRKKISRALRRFGHPRRDGLCGSRKT